MQLAEAAIAYRRAGLSVLPARVREKRPAVRTWKAYQTRLPGEDEIAEWFTAAEGLCLIAGAVSGNLEMLDFDLAGEAFPGWYELVRATGPELLEKLVIEQSPSGGWHVAYRCQSSVCGNQKLAQRKQMVEGPEEVTIAGKGYKPRRDGDGQWHVLLTMIETRGEGGLFLCAPTPGYELFQGEFTQLPVLSDEQRELLLQSAWSLNTHSPANPQAFASTVQVGQSTPVTTEIPKSPGGSGPLGQQTSEGDNRPGDEFNQRGDVRAVLRKHGWTLAKGGDNEYWRRPGKSSGSSATLKDGVFYVFSSSAAPFEEGRPYAPFSVYALLEHQGDFSAAAAALRLEGFGGDVGPAPDVDLAEFERRLRLSEMRRMVGLPAEEPPPASESTPPAAPRSAEIPTIPEELLRVPGFVGDVMDFCLGAARYPSLPLAFCGAMALQSFLASRKVREQGGLRPNLYMLALADSGTGKAYPRKINSYILGKLGLGGAVGNQIASGQGLEDEMQSHRKMLFQTDEVDHLLRCLSSTKETYYSMLLGMLLQLYTEADEVHSMRTRARDKGRPNQIRGEIDQPGLVIFGTATPECFFEAMSPRLLTNGLFSRSIVVDVPKRSRKQMSRDVSELPDRLLEVARWWKDYNPGPLHPVTGRKPNLDDEHPTPAVVPYSEDGFAVLDRFGTHADDEYDAAREAGDQVRAIIWTRASENATRLALVYACSRNHESPEIDIEAAEWATRFVDHLVRRMLYLATQHVAANPFHAECLKLLRKLRAAPNQQMQRQHLLRAAHCKASDFDQMIATLIQQGDIVPADIPTKTKPALGYRLA